MDNKIFTPDEALLTIDLDEQATHAPHPDIRTQAWMDTYPNLAAHLPAYYYEALRQLPSPLLNAMNNDPYFQELFEEYAGGLENFATGDTDIPLLWSGGGYGLTFYNDRSLSSANHELAAALQAQAPEDTHYVLLEDTPAGEYAEKLAMHVSRYREAYPPYETCIKNSYKQIFESASEEFISYANNTVAIAGDFSYPLSILRRTEMKALLDNPEITHVLSVHLPDAVEAYVPPTTALINGKEVIVPDPDAYHLRLPFEIDGSGAIDKFAWAEIMKNHWLAHAIDQLEIHAPQDNTAAIADDSPYRDAAKRLAIEILRIGEHVSTLKPETMSPREEYNPYLLDHYRRLFGTFDTIDDHPAVKEEMFRFLGEDSRLSSAVRQAYSQHPDAMSALTTFMAREEMSTITLEDVHDCWQSREEERLSNVEMHIPAA